MFIGQVSTETIFFCRNIHHRWESLPYLSMAKCIEQVSAETIFFCRARQASLFWMQLAVARWRDYDFKNRNQYVNALWDLISTRMRHFFFFRCCWLFALWRAKGLLGWLPNFWQAKILANLTMFESKLKKHVKNKFLIRMSYLGPKKPMSIKILLFN